MTTRELLQMALDVVAWETDEYAQKLAEQIRAHLAKPEPEPVAWRQIRTGVVQTGWGFDRTGYEPLYTKDQL